MVAYEVRNALLRWEPRVNVDDVDVRLDPDDAQHRSYIDIRYTIKHTNDPRNLVFPFYVIPPKRTPASSPRTRDRVLEE